MIERVIKTSKQKQYIFQSRHPDITAWFADPENHTETILRQINEERMYDPIFNDKNDLVVLDLGANCGLFSLYAADSCKRLISVEPTPKTFNVLQEMLKDQINVTPLQLAIGPHNEMISFFINENSTTNSIVDRSGVETKVQCMTLETLLNMQSLDHVDFVKCDIEGSEMQAITDATLAPVADRIAFWFVEVHQTNPSESAWPGNLESNRQALAEIFQRNGYQTEAVIHDQLFAWK